MKSGNHIQTALSLLFRPGSVVELRALGDRTHYGYYTDYEKLARDAAILDTTPGITGIYITLNQVNPVLLSRCANRIKTAHLKEPQTADGDIIRRNWLPVDIDPQRPAGISSSDEEHAAALEKAYQIREYLTSLGWPDPIIADSGNGAHLLYPIDLPVDQESAALIRSCLKALDQHFSDDQSTIDTSVANPARIWKLYGTRSRKGDHTPERPHRQASIISSPPASTSVHVPMLMALAAQYSEPATDPSGQPVPADQSTPASPIDLADWLTVHGLSYTEKPYHAGRLFVFDECPFSDAHKDGAYAIQFPNGAIFAGCHHNSCGGNTQRWHELRERFEGASQKPKKPKRNHEEWFKTRKIQQARAKAERDGTIPPESSAARPDTLIPPAEITGEDPDITDEVRRILHEGDPITYILDTFAQAHEGDRIVAHCLLMSLASRHVINSKGLHVLVTGESGKGKSHAFETMMDLIPQEYCLGGRITDKALFYEKTLRKGSVICLDDVSLSHSLQETLRGVTTSFQKKFIYRTLDKDRNSLTKVIPERCLWWIAKKEGTGDDQVWNRMLTVWIDDSQEQDDLVLARELEEAARPANPDAALSREMKICRALWNHLPSVSVRIPFAKRIRFTNSKNRRNSTMLLDLVRSGALMYQFQRKRVEIGGIIEIEAEIEDFKRAQEIYHLLNGTCGAQMTKMTRTEQMLIDAIRASGKTEFTVKEMQRFICRSQSTVSRLLSGNPKREDHEGLLLKCPPLSYVDRSEPREGGGYERARIYTWDYELDEVWSTGTACWLDESDDSGSHTDTNPNGDPNDGPDGDQNGGTKGDWDSPDGDTDSQSGEQPDGAMHLCTAMHDLCTQKCIDAAPENEPVSKNTDDLADSPSAMHNPGSAYSTEHDDTSSLYAPGKSAYIPSKSVIYSDISEKEGNTLSTSMHKEVHTPCIAVHSMHSRDDMHTRLDMHARPDMHAVQDIEQNPAISAIPAIPVGHPIHIPHPMHHLHPVHPVHIEPRSDAVIDADKQPEKRNAILDIHPGMFYTVEKKPDQVCSVCGRRGVSYREKKRKNPPPGHQRRMICDRCYSAAVSREVMTCQALPGVIPVHTMKQTDRSLGRCTLCHLHPVTWFDDETRTGLCERCYHRERFRSRNNAGGSV